MACAHDRSAVSARSALVVVVAPVFNFKTVLVSAQCFVISAPVQRTRTPSVATDQLRTIPFKTPKRKNNEDSENHQYAIVGHETKRELGISGTISSVVFVSFAL